ncbi:enolase C-terminal domain-like protein [Caballeronia humi]|uniref:Mandelate racemase/muconate lactonizing protein n=1 Tax=Caballeronia humi TaxID=326474 RepID=A0A158JCW8_9BURK|nr:enolase C-terminal domain-like protein [Caballeronia humi]SAL66677.1 mandelate racemase/muconate lactonizing protein [Caballeronia humi]
MNAPIPDTVISSVRAQAYTIPTDAPEADGTFAWESTTLVVAEVDAGGETGIGYTYTDACAALLIREALAEAVEGCDAFDVRAACLAMQKRVRNIGRAGVAATAISALDCALWDVKAKLLDVPLARLLGAMRESVPIYGSGGFTTYTNARLKQQLSGWVVDDGCRWVKIKIGSAPERDPKRVHAAREAIGEAGLFVDANGAFTEKEASHYANVFKDFGVLWFEEPVSSDDLCGLNAVRSAVRAPMQIAAGEYGFTLDYFRRMLDARAVDVLQADASRCGGITGFLNVAALCEAYHVPLSAHCAPALHLHVACAAPQLVHQEWFYDHVRIEAMLFDGAPRADGGAITPDLSRSGCGLELRRADAQVYAV